MKNKFNGVFIKSELDPKTVKENIEAVLNSFSNALLKLDPELTTKYLYWLNTLASDYLPKEKTFDPLSLIKYERGNIIEVDLGFKVGSEQGGFHYAVIMDCDNKKSSPVVMVVPLKSLSDGESIDEKIEVLIDENIFELEKLKFQENIDKINKELLKEESDIARLEKNKKFYEKEINKFSKKSVAQPSQMCALSKIRILFPTKASDKLYGLKLPEKHMKKIEEKLLELFF